MLPILQLNWQTQFGGGEVYTAFLCQAFQALAIPQTVLTHPKAAFWSALDLPESTQLLPCPQDLTALISKLPKPAILLTHTSVPVEWRTTLKTQGIKLVGIAHMPLYGRNPRSFDGYDGVIAVSQYVLTSLQEAQAPNPYPNPWYGIARDIKPSTNTFKRQSEYDWDKRKGRDRLLSWLEPITTPFHAKPNFVKRTGLTLGVVSRLTPIKQFPTLFQYLTPILKHYPTVNLEIIGSGGYASVRDLKQVLAPLGKQVRFWGHQSELGAVYSQLDYLLTGLPEKEALGLNVLEAQSCNLPVLAPKAPPFTETIIHEITGYLYQDPRVDQGKEFKKLLENLMRSDLTKTQPTQATTHLERFKLAAFTKRIEATLPWINSL